MSGCLLQPTGFLLGMLVAAGLVLFPAAGPAFRYEITWPSAVGSENYGLPPGQSEWYVTQGNNLQVLLHTSGQHRVWVEQKAILWPRGSGEKMMAYPGLWYGGVGDFSLDEKMDTTIQRHNDSAHQPGRVPTNFWWRQTGSYFEAQQDLDGDGKGDINGDPIVLSDEPAKKRWGSLR